MGDERSWFVPGQVPRLLRYAALIVLAGCIAMTFIGGWRIGVTWDEPIHIQRLRNYFDSGWYLAYGQLQDGRPTPGMEQQYVYGPVTMLFLHLLNVVTGHEGWGSVSSTAHAYAVRHLGVALISVAGLAAVGATARMILRRWDWAVVAAAVLAATPLWTGHAMFNVKDVPVATAYAFVTMGLCAIARDTRVAGLAVRVGGPAALGLGTFLALGTRPGMWTAIAASCGAMCLCRWVRSGNRRLGLAEDWWRYRDLAIALAPAWLVLAALDPKAFSSPVTLLIKSANGSAHFLGLAATRGFVPIHVLVQVPALVLAFFVIGVFVTLGRVWRARRSLGAAETRLVLVLVQVFTLPGVTLIHRAALYGDLRQLLFAAPATAIIATVGISRIVSSAQQAKDPGVAKMAAVLAAASVVAPALDQATLFPYNYAYYNPLSKAADLELLGDYYRASGREIVPMLPTTGRIVCSPEGMDDNHQVGRMAHLDGWVDCAHTLSSPIAAYAGGRAWTDAPALAPDEFWAVSFSDTHSLPKNCTAVDHIDRWTLWRTMRMASLWRCQYPFPTVSPGVIDLKTPTKVPRIPDLGWVVTGVDDSQSGLSTYGAASTFTFRFSPAFAGHGAVVTLRTSRDVDARAAFGGVDATVRRPSEGESRIEIDIPEAAVSRALSTATTLELRAVGRGPLDVSVLSFAAAIAN